MTHLTVKKTRSARSASLGVLRRSGFPGYSPYFFGAFKGVQHHGPYVHVNARRPLDRKPNHTLQHAQIGCYRLALSNH